ncbi:MAG: MerR family transcriptional regulator [Deltaproteobacteria bacterium]|nr:MAG: MerR family transcriptional regulator [Deltaproteobacteria bacterium]
MGSGRADFPEYFIVFKLVITNGAMKISELAGQTGVPKETIHHYVREGLLRKPRKTGKNVADYNQNHVEQILLIKDLRENYYLPLPVIKKIIKRIKKQSSVTQFLSQLRNKYFRPVDRLLTKEIVGRDAFREATGLGRKWLHKAEGWEVITAELRNGQPVFSADDVAIGKLMVDMDRIGFGPREGHDPEDLKYISDFVREFVVNNFNKYYQSNLEKLSSADYPVKAGQFHEVISLFFYHLYRKFARESVDRLLRSKETDADIGNGTKKNDDPNSRRFSG